MSLPWKWGWSYARPDQRHGPQRQEVRHRPLHRRAGPLPRPPARPRRDARPPPRLVRRRPPLARPPPPAPTASLPRLPRLPRHPSSPALPVAARPGRQRPPRHRQGDLPVPLPADHPEGVRAVPRAELPPAGLRPADGHDDPRPVGAAPPRMAPRGPRRQLRARLRERPGPQPAHHHDQRELAPGDHPPPRRPRRPRLPHLHGHPPRPPADAGRGTRGEAARHSTCRRTTCSTWAPSSRARTS